jgi:O-antigen/teichoic acid export membrane protein
MIPRLRALGGARSLTSWLGKGFSAMADQGLFTASNFLVSILLARWLSPQDYGAFAVAYAVFWLVGVVHNALLTEPMLVFGSDKHKGRFTRYLGVLIYGHVGFGVACALLLLLGGLVAGLMGSRALSLSLLALAGASPFMLLQVLMRRACYVTFRPHLAASGGALYMFLMLGGAYLLYQAGKLSAVTAFGLMGLSGLAVGLLLAAVLRLRLPSSDDGALVRLSVNDHWNYGSWSVGTRTMVWVTESSYFLILPIWGGLEASAALRALMNLIMPVLQSYAALSVLLLPALVQARGGATFGRVARLSLVLFVSGSTLYWLVLGLFHRPLIDWLYDGRYNDYSHLIWVLALVPVIFGVAEVQSTVLRALEKVDLVFWASVVSTALALTAGLGAVYALGVSGAVVWLLLSGAANVLAMWWFASYGPKRWRNTDGTGA